jgi:hypothetical protein
VSDNQAERPTPGEGSPAHPRELFRLRIIRCAWCGRETVRPIPEDADAEVVAHRHLMISDGICEECFGEHLPEVPYPEED